MERPSPQSRSPDSLTVKLGSFFEAHATGRGVFAIPIVVILLVIGATAKLLT